MNPVPVGTLVRVASDDFPNNCPRGAIGSVTAIAFDGIDALVKVTPVGSQYDWPFYWRELEPTGQMMPAAKQTIDHGRVATLDRRAAFREVHLVLSGSDVPTDIMLSPRRLHRHVFDSLVSVEGEHDGKFPRELAAIAHEMLCEYANGGLDLLKVAPRAWHSWSVVLQAGRVEVSA